MGAGEKLMLAHRPTRPNKGCDHADPGIYREAGIDPLAVYGTGWYHYSTPDDQRFSSHKREKDVYIFDYQVTSDGSYVPIGNDKVDVFESNLDTIAFLARCRKRPLVGQKLVPTGGGQRPTAGAMAAQERGEV
jgi:hypothetical protein